MPCIDCFNNCPDNPTDLCVKYTGPDIELFGICTGDPISSVIADIITKVNSALDGTGITLANITFANAPWLATLFGTKDKTLYNLIQFLIDTQQTLKGLVDDLQEEAFAFNTSCLTGLPADPSRDDIVQAALNKLCQINTTVNSFPSTYVKSVDLPTLVKTIITTGTNNQPKQYKDYTIPYTAFPYFGPISNFDATGKGLSSVGFDRIFICNGLNGTPDMRGRSPIGAVKNVPGPTPDNTVNPNHTLNAKGNVNYGVGEKFGTNYQKLTAAEVPAHSHTINDPGHKHALPKDHMPVGLSMPSLVESDNSDENYSNMVPTDTATTGITINPAGGSESHYNVHPVMGCLYIMYRP